MPQNMYTKVSLINPKTFNGMQHYPQQKRLCDGQNNKPFLSVKLFRLKGQFNTQCYKYTMLLYGIIIETKSFNYSLMRMKAIREDIVETICLTQ